MTSYLPGRPVPFHVNRQGVCEYGWGWVFVFALDVMEKVNMEPPTTTTKDTRLIHVMVQSHINVTILVIVHRRAIENVM